MRMSSGGVALLVVLLILFDDSDGPAAVLITLCLPLFYHARSVTDLVPFHSATRSSLEHTDVLPLDTGKDTFARDQQILMEIGVVNGGFVLSRKLEGSYTVRNRLLSRAGTVRALVNTLALQYDVVRLNLSEPVWRG